MFDLLNWISLNKDKNASINTMNIFMRSLF